MLAPLPTSRLLRTVVTVFATVEHAAGVAVCATFVEPHLFTGAILVTLIAIAIGVWTLAFIEGVAK